MRHFADRTGDGFSAFGRAVDGQTVFTGMFEFETSGEREAFVAEQRRAISAGERGAAFAGMFEAAEATQVRGRLILDWSSTLDRWRSEKNDEEALPLLLEIVAACELSAEVEGRPALPGWTERAAIVLRRNGRYQEECSLIERYLDQWPGYEPLVKRLTKAMKLAGRHEV